MAALLMVNCNGTGSTETEILATSDQALATGFKGPDGRFLVPWSSPGTISVCFLTNANANGTPGTPDPTLVANITSAMQRTWQAHTGITFSFQGNCPTTIPSSWISIFIDNDGSYTNSQGAMAGVGQRFSPSYSGTDWAKIGPQIGYRTDVQAYLANSGADWTLLTAHEIGHVLGFYHEMERNDNNSSCLANANGNAYGHMTPYDQNSIMLWSYCPNSLTAASPLTLYDQLGAEMVYPLRYTGERLACSSNCVETNNGVVVRSTGAATIDWIRRGAEVGFLGAPVWNYGSTTIQPADGILRASSMPAGSTTVNVTFGDAYKRSHSGSGNVQKSDALHTAIIGVAVTPC